MTPHASDKLRLRRDRGPGAGKWFFVRRPRQGRASKRSATIDRQHVLPILRQPNGAAEIAAFAQMHEKAPARQGRRRHGTDDPSPMMMATTELTMMCGAPWLGRNGRTERRRRSRGRRLAHGLRYRSVPQVPAPLVRGPGSQACVSVAPCTERARTSASQFACCRVSCRAVVGCRPSSARRYSSSRACDSRSSGRNRPRPGQRRRLHREPAGGGRGCCRQRRSASKISLLTPDPNGAVTHVNSIAASGASSGAATITDSSGSTAVGGRRLCAMSLTTRKYRREVDYLFLSLGPETLKRRGS